MVVTDMQAVLDFLRRNGFVEAESALRDDILHRDGGGLVPPPPPPPPPSAAVGSPRSPAPPPPVRIVVAGRRRTEAPADGEDGSSSSSNSSSAFVSMGSSPSELVNPFGLWSPNARIKSEDDSSERHSEFGTARDYNDPGIWNDMYWYNERDGGLCKQQCCEGMEASSCLSEDKFVMTVGEDVQFGTTSGVGSSLVQGGFHSMTSINCLDNPAHLFTSDDASMDDWKDRPDTKLLERAPTPLCDCCSGQKGCSELESGNVGCDYGDKEQLGESDISLYGCCYELMSDDRKSLQDIGGLEEFTAKIVNECPTAVSWELNVTGYSNHDTMSLGNNKQDSVPEFLEKRLQVLDSMVSERTSSTSGDSPSNIKMNIDFNSSNKNIFENTIGDDNASPSNRNYKNYETGGITPIREPQDDGTTIGGEEHATAIELQMYDNHEDEYEIFDLRIIHRKNRTGFEENKDFPIVLNTIIAGRYYVTEFLGSAAFSKVIQAHDLQTGMDVCIKIIKNDKDFFDQSLDEIKLLKYVNKYDPADEHHLLRLYDYFYHQEHLFIVSELLRANLYEFQKFNHDSGGEVYFTLPRLQRIAQQCLEALEYLHYLGIIHCDLKPENILIKSYSRCEIKVIDLGSSCFQTDNLCLYVQSRSYRAPEVILGLPYDQRIDIWSLGCILAELCSGDVLFPNDSLVLLLARMVGMFGPIDMEMLVRGQETYKYFTSDYDLYHKNEETNQLEYIIPEKCSLTSRLEVSDTGFIEFIRELLQMNPGKRPTATEALHHPWLSEPY